MQCHFDWDNLQNQFDYGEEIFQVKMISILFQLSADFTQKPVVRTDISFDMAYCHYVNTYRQSVNYNLRTAYTYLRNRNNP